MYLYLYMCDYVCTTTIFVIYILFFTRLHHSINTKYDYIVIFLLLQVIDQTSSLWCVAAMHWTDGSEVFPCFGGWLRNRNGKEVCHEMQHGNVQVMTSAMFHENRNHILSHVKVTLRISASQDINICFFWKISLGFQPPLKQWVLI